MRLHSPMVVFKPSVILSSIKDLQGNHHRDLYMQSGVPASINILESLKGDPSLQGAIPKLTASRLSGIAPLARDEAVSDQNIKIIPQKAFRALPAISGKVYCSKLNGRMARPFATASLDIETAPFSKERMIITDVKVELHDGLSEHLGDAYAPALPIVCQPKDNIVCLYRLTPVENLGDRSKQSLAKMISITIRSTIFVSDTCQPRIEMKWKTSIDFSTALNPIYGTPGQSMQRSSRPSSLATSASASDVNVLPTTTREDKSSLDSRIHPIRQQTASVSNSGLFLTVTAPSTTRTGVPFSWHVLVMNRCSKPRQLALNLVWKQDRSVDRGHLLRAPKSPITDLKRAGVVDAVTDEDSLWIMQGSGRKEVARVLSLMMDVQIG